MNSTIYKYRLDITNQQVVSMPMGAKFLHAGPDPYGDPCVWYQVMPDDPKIDHTFFLVGTGNPIPSKAKVHLGSFLMGPLVLHLFSP